MAEPRRRRHTVRFALAAVVLVGLLFAFVYPTRTFIDQRDDTSRARAQLDVLRTENAKLERAEARLQDPTEIEKLARRYGLVKPNEAAFVVVPAPEPVVAPTPDATATLDTAPEGADATAP
jgi:cell division protein FtsB